MNRSLMRSTIMCVLAAAVSSPALAQSGVPFGPKLPAAIPPDIEAPAGYSVFYRAHALGTQNYMCLPTPTGFAWKLFAPQATLFQTFKGDLRQQLITHFLSANPDEPGTLRPTWQHSSDSSRIWAKALVPSSDSNYVEAGAIPWLLLEVTGRESGPAGGAFMTQAAYIHRLNTSGGLAPATGCSQASVGAVALVPYEADYFFYRGPSGQ